MTIATLLCPSLTLGVSRALTAGVAVLAIACSSYALA